MKKSYRLTPDQFQIDEQGHLSINHEEISEGLRRQEPTELAAPEDGSEVTVSVKISF